MLGPVYYVYCLYSFTLSVVEDTSEGRAACNEPIVAVAVPALSLPRFTGLRCAIYSQRSRVQLEL